MKNNKFKYAFEDKDLIYYTNKIIYKYEELFPIKMKNNPSDAHA